MRKNYKLAVRLGVVTLLVLAFTYLLVSLYDIGGLNDQTIKAAESPSHGGVDMERSVTLQFLSYIEEPQKWRIQPKKESVEVHPGVQYSAYYTAKNLSDRYAVSRALPSVSPKLAARHLEKIECFCFEEQAFEPFEERDMLVRFKVDPRLPEQIETISLSYKFFDVYTEQPD